MERMKLLQESQLEAEDVTQEEMATRFELEKAESLLVAPLGKEVQGAGWERGLCGPGRLHRRTEGANMCLGRSRTRPPAAGLALPGVTQHSQPLS